MNKLGIETFLAHPTFKNIIFILMSITWSATNSLQAALNSWATRPQYRIYDQ